jgi:hypothetical protein
VTYSRHALSFPSEIVWWGAGFLDRLTAESRTAPDWSGYADHPLRAIRGMTDEALRRLSPRFDAIYAEGRRRRFVAHATDAHVLLEKVR